LTSSNLLTKVLYSPIAFWRTLTKYEKIYYASAILLTVIFAILFPEEDVNGHNGKIVMAIMLIYTVLNVTCELQIAKQSKWNFIVSVFIEIAEITMFILLASRFATMATTLFFWLPVDIISFIAWRKHPDREEKELTEVRSLTGWQEVMVILGIVLWTVLIGTLLCYITENLTISSLFEGRREIEIIVCYLDAMVSALDIANGLFILFRFKEQWVAWYLEVIFDAIAWILTGQFVMLALTICYLVNTTYGYIKWTKYIKSHNK